MGCSIACAGGWRRDDVFGLCMYVVRGSLMGSDKIWEYLDDGTSSLKLLRSQINGGWWLLVAKFLRLQLAVGSEKHHTKSYSVKV